MKFHEKFSPRQADGARAYFRVGENTLEMSRPSSLLRGSGGNRLASSGSVIEL
jgi:hypothetical protein